MKIRKARPMITPEIRVPPETVESFFFYKENVLLFFYLFFYICGIGNYFFFGQDKKLALKCVSCSSKNSGNCFPVLCFFFKPFFFLLMMIQLCNVTPYRFYSYLPFNFYR